MKVSCGQISTRSAMTEWNDGSSKLAIHDIDVYEIWMSVVHLAFNPCSSRCCLCMIGATRCFEIRFLSSIGRQRRSYNYKQRSILW